MKRIYTEEIWEEFESSIEKNFKLKTYPHFDPLFDFSKRKDEIKRIVSSPERLVKSYSFLPLLKVLIKTPRYRWQEDLDIPNGGKYDLETKIRPISFASHKDTYIYGFYAFALNKLYQEYIKAEGFGESILAYRTDLNGKCNIQFAKEVFDLIQQEFNTQGTCSVIALDIKGYFDHIDHKILKDSWSKIIQEDSLPDDHHHIFRSLTKYSYVNWNSFLKHFNINLKKLKREQKKKFPKSKIIPKGYDSILDLIPNEINGPSFKDKMNLLRKRNLVTVNSQVNKQTRRRELKKCGIPQGSAMSAVLSNIYLTYFDRQIYEKGQKEGFLYRRYCDDLLIICQPDQVNQIKDDLMKLIKDDFHLTIQNKKTDVIDFKRNESGTIRSFRRSFNPETKEFLPLSNTSKNYKNIQYLGFEFNGKNIYIRPGSLSRYFRKMKARITKTVAMAYSENSKSDVIFKKQLFSRYSHIGKRNFISYALKASQKSYQNKDGIRMQAMNSGIIKRQISRHMNILQRELEKASSQRAEFKKLDTPKR